MKGHRLSLVAKKLNIGMSKIFEILDTEGFKIDSNPNATINNKQLDILSNTLSSEIVEDYFSNQSLAFIGIKQIIVNFQLALMQAFLHHDSSKKQEVDKEYIKFLFDNIEPKNYPILKVSEWEYLSLLEKEKKILISQCKNHLKLLVRGFKVKPLNANIKFLKYKLQSILSAIISPKIFHVYVDETDKISVALNHLSLSNTSLNQFREAVFHSINSKFLIQNEIRIN